MSEKPTVTADFVRAAIDNYTPWKLGNDVLYKLCAMHPRHTEDAVIIGKFWLIGRSYAAAIERRRMSAGREVSEDYRGDDIVLREAQFWRGTVACSLLTSPTLSLALLILPSVDFLRLRNLPIVPCWS